MTMHPLIRLIVCSLAAIAGFNAGLLVFTTAFFLIGYGVGAMVDRLFCPGFLGGFLAAGWVFCLLPVGIGALWGGWMAFRLTGRWISRHAP